jgi:hypothetical protein
MALDRPLGFQTPETLACRLLADGPTTRANTGGTAPSTSPATWQARRQSRSLDTAHARGNPMYVERIYYLAPDGRMAADAVAVIREGMKGKVGWGKLALYGREYLVAVKSH